MKKLWITYAWADNKDQDIDFIASRIAAPDIEVKLDRWTISAGERLWPQIEKAICSVEESDAWLIFATEASLASMPCQEELAYALDRALSKRGDGFPLIALSPTTNGVSMFPAALRTRLCVSLEDPDWLERVQASTRGVRPSIPRAEVLPYFFKLHPLDGARIAIEFRPREGVWMPFAFGVPIAERTKLTLVMPHAAGIVPDGTWGGAITEGDNKNVYYWEVSSQISPAVSGFAFLNSVPSRCFFGSPKKDYWVDFRNVAGDPISPGR